MGPIRHSEPPTFPRTRPAHILSIMEECTARSGKSVPLLATTMTCSAVAPVAVGCCTTTMRSRGRVASWHSHKQQSVVAREAHRLYCACRTDAAIGARLSLVATPGCKIGGRGVSARRTAGVRRQSQRTRANRHVHACSRAQSTATATATHPGGDSQGQGARSVAADCDATALDGWLRMRSEEKKLHRKGETGRERRRFVRRRVRGGVDPRVTPPGWV